MSTLVYPFKVGELHCFVINDFSSTDTVEGLIVNSNAEELEQVAHEYSFDPENIPVDYNNLFLRIGERNVLVDAGIPRPMGNLFQGLEELGIAPSEIDIVVITHSDRDHVGGLLDEEGEISFPNASHIMMEDFWDFWTTQEKRAELTQLNNWT